MIKAKDFFALPPAERQLLMSQHENLKISLGVHADNIATSRFQDIANGTKALEQADLLYNRNEPGVEYLVLKIRG